MLLNSRFRIALGTLITTGFLFALSPFAYSLEGPKYPFYAALARMSPHWPFVVVPIYLLISYFLVYRLHLREPEMRRRMLQAYEDSKQKKP